MLARLFKFLFKEERKGMAQLKRAEHMRKIVLPKEARALLKKMNE